jgi:tRNA threonylcarbamoyl adenosine modification protein YeaZ
VFVLAIDTSSPAVTAGVVTVPVSGEVVLAAGRSVLAARGHSELLAPLVADCLREAGTEAAALSAVVVGTGPGPYTGLRVGLVTAAALADALGIPAYGVGSLDAIAAAAPGEGELIVASDARRKEVYWARYDAHGDRIDGPHVSRPLDVAVDGAAGIAGAGAQLHGGSWPRLDRRPADYPEPVALVGLAIERIRTGAPSEPLSPLYLRRPDAVVPGAPKPVSQ